MSTLRLSRGPFLAAWAAIVAVQLVPFALGWAPGVAMAAAWIGLWQLVKVVPTLGRMRDLGRAPDDALFGTLVPFANLYLFFAFCLQRTPDDTRRASLIARWEGQPSWYGVAVPALRLMARGAGPGLLGVLVLAVPVVLILDKVEESVPTWQATMSAESLASAQSASLALAAVLGLYTAMNLAKRSKASPISWLPSILLMPSLALAGTFAAVASPSFSGLTPLHVALVSSAIIFLWHSVVGAAVAVAWVAAAAAAEAAEGVTLDGVWKVVKARTLDVMPSYAARVQLVWIGGQVIVPGLFYWVYTAFVAMAGTLETPPPHPLTTRSGALSWGIMSRLVKLAFVYAVIVNAVSLGLVVLLHGSAVGMAALTMDLSLVPLPTQLLAEVLGDVALWWVTVALYLMYRGRVRQLEERAAARAAA